MQHTNKRTIAELKKLNLKGLEIVGMAETTSNDLLGATIRDAVTGVTIEFRRNQYSEFAIYTDAPKKTEERFVVDGKNSLGATIHFEAKTQVEADKFIADSEGFTCAVEKKNVEIDE